MRRSGLAIHRVAASASSSSRKMTAGARWRAAAKSWRTARSLSPRYRENRSDLRATTQRCILAAQPTALAKEKAAAAHAPVPSGFQHGHGSVAEERAHKRRLAAARRTEQQHAARHRHAESHKRLRMQDGPIHKLPQARFDLGVPAANGAADESRAVCRASASALGHAHRALPRRRTRLARPRPGRPRRAVPTLGGRPWRRAPEQAPPRLAQARHAGATPRGAHRPGGRPAGQGCPQPRRAAAGCPETPSGRSAESPGRSCPPSAG